MYLPRTPMHWAINHVTVTSTGWKTSVSAYSVAYLKQVWKRPLPLISTKPISLNKNIKPSFKMYYQMHSKNKCSVFSSIFFHKSDDIPGYTGGTFSANVIFEQSIGDKCSKPSYPENPSRCTYVTKMQQSKVLSVLFQLIERFYIEWKIILKTKMVLSRVTFP